LTQRHWKNCCARVKCPTSRVYTIADIYADPHFAARGMLAQVPHPTLGHTTQTGVLPRLSGTRRERFATADLRWAKTGWTFSPTTCIWTQHASSN
jgi:crotonobetainyl-CoA:carnitine CoA-transferase CaiB-like acyl-CoA transferase